MGESPGKNADKVLKLTVYSGGNRLADTIHLHSIEVEKRVNAISRARIVVIDGDMPKGNFPISAGDTLKPGAEVQVSAGYGSSEESIFEGVVVRHGIKVSNRNFSRLVLECRDKAVKMTIGRKNANFVDKKDSDIITTLIGSYGLTSDVSATSAQHKELVQFYCSDWDFMLSRAEANGLLVSTEAGKVSVNAPKDAAESGLAVQYGKDLMELEAEVDAASQLASVAGASWNPATQKVAVSPTVAPQVIKEQGNLTSKALSDVAGPATFRLQTAAPMESAVLQEWATGCQVKAALARIRGSMKFQGSAKAKVGTLIELSGVGARFNGKVLVTAVTHTIAKGNWTTTVEFGLSADWFAERRDLVAPPAAGLLPGVEGLQIGVVKKLAGDPEKQHKIQVSVPLMEAETDGVWARLAQFHGSKEFGSFFVPEVGDEVVLAYLNNDPSHPVVIGSLYSSGRCPPYTVTDDNFLKGIVTKSKLKVEFNDDKKAITIVTPAGNKIVVNDEEKSILMQDQTGNKVKLSSDGISLDSPKDIAVKATGKITLDASGQIAISSTADVTVSGMNVTNEAKTAFAAKGNATAELSASGQTTVKGAMVMIN